MLTAEFNPGYSDVVPSYWAIPPSLIYVNVWWVLTNYISAGFGCEWTQAVRRWWVRWPERRLLTIRRRTRSATKKDRIDLRLWASLQTFTLTVFGFLKKWYVSFLLAMFSLCPKHIIIRLLLKLLFCSPYALLKEYGRYFVRLLLPFTWEYDDVCNVWSCFSCMNCNKIYL